MQRGSQFQKLFIQFIKPWYGSHLYIPPRRFIASLKLLLLIISGAILLCPLVKNLPMVGWDWYYFFNANNAEFNLYTDGSAYPPFARYFIQLLSWMDWRTSLAILNGITLMTIAVATWKNGGRYLQIILALTMPPLWFLMWVGHPDGLVLLGLISGVIPLVLMKPILSIFGILNDRKKMVWSLLLLTISVMIWPNWIFSLSKATIGHEAEMGWLHLGWPIFLFGILLFVGAGKNMYQLIAAGCFLTPYLMPYHMAILIPAIGATRGWRQWAIWTSAWFVFIGTGLPEKGHLISFLFPLFTYFLVPSPDKFYILRSIKRFLRM